MVDIVVYKKRFDQLYKTLLWVSATFYSWKGLQNAQYESTYNQEKTFWSVVLSALQDEWLISLAKCFEDSRFSKRNKVVSVYALLQYHPDPIRARKAGSLLQKHKAVLFNISQLRHRQLAHLNAEHLANPKALLRGHPIVYGHVEALLQEFPELISLLNPESGIGYSLGGFVKDPESEAIHVMDKLQYVREKEKEHLDRYSAGEIDDPFFLPRRG